MLAKFSFTLIIALVLFKGISLIAGQYETYKITYYWTEVPVDQDYNSESINVYNLENEVIAKAPKSLIERIAMEGSGYLPDGRLINLSCACPFPNSKFFVVDKEKAPWGMDARGFPLVKDRSIAVLSNTIKLGQSVYIKEFDGLELENGEIHDGCFIAGDTGYSLSKKHLDVFVGTKRSYEYTDNKLKEIEQVSVSLNSPQCVL